MKLYAIVALCAIPLFTSFVEAVECTVMTFNVRFGSAKDGENAWEHRKELLVATIRQANPDIVGTQECLDFQAKYIVEQLPEYAWIGLGRQADATGEMTAILYRKDKLIPIESRHLWLSETPGVPGSKSWDSSLPRIATRVLFYHREAQTPFIVYNTHFDHQGEVARYESAKLLGNVMEAETLPCVLMGDFNALGGGSQPWQALLDTGLQDAWQTAETTSGSANTWNGFKTPEEGADRRIDWILVSPDIQVSECVTVDQGLIGPFPSDHFPVWARISVPKSGGNE